MKKVSLLIVGVLMGISGLQGALLERPWTKVALPPFISLVDGVAVDRYTIYGIQAGGGMALSTDGGKIWTDITDQVGSARYHDVCRDPITGITAVGEEGTATFRIGVAPSTLLLNSNHTLTGVASGNGVIIIAGIDENDGAVAYRSTNNGATVEPIDLGLGNAAISLTGVRFIGVTNVVIYGVRHAAEGVGNPFIMYSNDAGVTWDESELDDRAFAVTAVAGNGVQLVAVGIQNGEGMSGYYRSFDGGETWQFVEEESLGLATDIIRMDAGEFVATAMRFVPHGEEVFFYQSEVSSVDGGANWNIRDIADGGGTMRLVRASDRLLAVGAEGAVYRRWYDKQPPSATLTPLTRHLEMGAMEHQQLCDQRTFAVAVNTSTQARRVASIQLSDVDGESGVGYFSADDIMPGDTLFVVLTMQPENLGEFWSALQVRFDNGTVLAWPVHGISTNNSTFAGVQLVEPFINVGRFVDMETQEPSVDVFTNAGTEPIEVTEITLGGDDVLAYAIANLDLPQTIAPGETFSFTASFEPYGMGVYTTDVMIQTSGGLLHIPAVATVREDVFQNVFNLGITHAGKGIETTLQFSHQQDNNPYVVQTMYGPRSPFEVRWTTPLPVELGPTESVTVNVAVKSNEAGSYASVLGVPFSFGGFFDARVERRVFVAMFGASTSVDEENAQPWTSWKIIDLAGRVIMEGALHSGEDATPLQHQLTSQMDALAVSAGTYLLVLSNNQTSFARKLSTF